MYHRIAYKQLSTRALSTATKTATATIKTAYSGVIKPKVSWLNLQGCGLSAIERLCLEEALLRHDPLERSWGIVGTHDPAHCNTTAAATTRLEIRSDTNGINDATTTTSNSECIIVMGIGGKPEKLLNLDKVRNNGVMVVKRFSGGGTVVLDKSSLWTTFIGRTNHFSHVEPFPRNIMEWSANDVFGPTFASLRTDIMKQRRGVETEKLDETTEEEEESDIPEFCLRENDYVLGKHKMGGNAQAIVRGAWLHHTSFLWDYENENMGYLTLPDKRPNYRKDRNHDDFLVKLKTYYGKRRSDAAVGIDDEDEGKRAFFNHVQSACATKFDLEEVTLKEAMDIVDTELGGMQHWFDGKCRTRLVSV